MLARMSDVQHAEYRARQRELWAIGAQAWKRWWAPFEAGANALSERIVLAARVAPGMRVLDLCTGLGEPALRVARLVGPQGHVVGADLSHAMLEFARERAAAAGLTNARFAEMEGERLALLSDAFDAATFRWGPMLMNDPVACLAEVRRVLKPGAHLGVSVWGTGKEVPFIALAGAVAEEVGGIAKPPPGTPGPLRMGRAGELELALAAAGFTDVHCEPVEVRMQFASTEEFVQFTCEVSTTLRTTLEERGAELRDAVWKELGLRAAKYADSSGRVVFVNRTWCAGARA
jgi:enediyne biosynthesis protein CalE5